MEAKMSLETVMRKIQKLKKLYEGAKKINSEGEANNAAALITKLLTEYNLSMDEVEMEAQKSKSEIIQESISGYEYRSIGGYWEQRLTHVLCRWNFCRCYIYGSSYKRLLIIGKKENLEMVKWLLDMLKERFVAFSKDRYKEYKNGLNEWEKPMSKDKFQRSYLMGCAVGLNAKLQEEHEREKREEVELSERITALVKRNDTELSKYVEEKLGEVGTVKTRERFDEARQRGFQDGRNTSLNRPIAGGRSEVSRQRLIG